MNGRKRHVLVDTMGLVLAAEVTPADVRDPAGAQALLSPLIGVFPRMSWMWVDMGYRGDFPAWVQQTLQWTVDVVKRPQRWVWCKWDDEPPPPLPKGFQVLRRRWVVERTFAWLGRYRRLSKDYEGLPETSESLIYAAMSRLMLRRLVQ